MSSDYEGTPVFLAECVANGVPIVATAVGGLPELLDHGRTGLLVAPATPLRSRAILALLRDPGRRGAIASAAAPRLHDYRIDVIAGRFADLYEQLYAEATHGAAAAARAAAEGAP